MKYIKHSIFILFFALILMACEEVVEPLTIQFDTQGGNIISDVTLEVGQPYDFPIPERVGYAFTGWYFSPTDTTPFVYDPLTFSLKTLKVYAKWNVITYNITYNLDGGVNGNNPSIYDIEDGVLNLEDAVKEGYVFNGWYRESSYTTSVSSINANELKDITLYAKFTINTYTITFDSDGGSLVSSITQDFNTAITNPSNPTRVGYTFTGWNITIPAFMPASNTTIKAVWSINSYTITFDSDGGSVVAPMTQDFNTAITNPSNPTRDGYTFTGWDISIPTLMPASNTTIKAVWSINSYTITFDSDGGSLVAPISQDFNTAITNPSNPTRDGYTFTGWDISIPMLMPASNTTIKALWSLNTYTITYNLDSGINGNNPDTYTITSDTINLLEASKVGYTFIGWFNQEVNGTKVDTISNGSFGNLSVFARFTINTYTITFDSNGGSVVSPMTQDFNTAITNPSNPTRDGYTFNTWDTTIPTIMPASNTTIKALWNLIDYVITYDLDSGVNGNNPNTYNIEDEVITLLSAIKVGFTFNGWYREGSYTTLVTTINANELKDITLYAKFTINTYTITFDSDGGSVVAPITQDFNSAITNPSNPTRDGYTFTGWDISIPTLMPASNTTIKAVWSINSYTITFDSDGGSVVSPMTQDFNTAITNPSNPTRDGYTFTGWDISIPTLMPASNTTIKAVWSINSYTITFDSDGGSLVAPISQDFNTAITNPSNPTRDGYTFTGWDISIPTLMPASNTTIKALWSLNTYTITYNLDSGINGNNPDTYTITSDTINLLEASKVGYTFIGWFNQEVNGTKVDTISNGSFGNLSVFARFTINTYTITFDSDGGSLVSPITQDFNTAITSPSNPTRDGYTFNTWDTTVPTIMPASNTTIKALWNLIDYVITYDLDSGVNGNNPNTYNIEDEVITLLSATKVGFTFNGWYREGSYTTLVTTINANELKDITLYAKFTIDTYTITFDSDGGSLVSPITQDFNTAITNPINPTRIGYTFTGWDISIPTLMPALNTTIKAVWSINSYTITFDSDGGSVVSPMTQDFNTAITNPSNPTRDGYTFTGWNISIPTLMPASNTTIKALWSLNTYTITYNLDSGINGNNPDTYTITSDTITLLDASKVGYTFTGWFNQEVGGSEVDTISSGSFGNVSLYARFSADVFNVTYNLDSGMNGNNPETYTIEDDVMTLLPANKTGYTFNGWYSEALYTTLVSQIIPTEIKDITLYARFTINSYTITFDSDGGSIVSPISQDFNTAITNPSNPTRVGYTFTGWDISIPTLMPAINTTIKALWSVNSYTITFDANGGSELLSITQDFGSSIEFNEIHVKDGYHFIGWDKELPKTMPAEDMILVARYIVIQFTIDITTGTLIGYDAIIGGLDVEIPSEIDGIIITAIGDSAFRETRIRSVIIPNTVVSIGNKAFQSNALTSVEIPSSVLTIESSAFSSNQLTTVIFSEGLKEISNYAFAFNLIQSIVLPESIENISQSTFQSNRITEVKIPAGMNHIGDQSFMDNSITSVTIEGIENRFNDRWGAIGFPAIYLPGVKIFGAFYVEESTGTLIGYDAIIGGLDVEIPSEIDGIIITAIGDSAFRETRIRSVIIPNTVVSIGNKAFQSNALTSVEIPSSVLTIESSAFSSNQLTTVIFSEGLKEISNYAFAFNLIQSIVLPESIENISQSTFQSNRITEVKIPAGMNHIGDQSFMDNSITSVTIEGIENRFNDRWGAIGFPAIYLPGVKIFGAFYVEESTGTLIGYDAIIGGLDVEIPSEIDGIIITAIGDSAFRETRIRSVIIPNTVVSIGNKAFQSNALTSVEIPSSVLTIESSAFSSNQLTTVIFSEGLKEISNYAFAFNLIQSIVLPESIENISQSTFQSNRITEVKIPAGMNHIGDQSFMDNSITSVTIEGIENRFNDRWGAIGFPAISAPSNRSTIMIIDDSMNPIAYVTQTIGSVFLVHTFH
jgi:uncharacterized repeat protein (TIGR02543 family)